MRLINSNTLQLEAFFTSPVPDYAILSHTWGPEEVTLQQFISSDERHEIQRRSGYIKIKEACALARSRQLGYVWVDTCCIDKTNSTELAESIASMFRWYEEANICFAFLEDVPPRTEQGTEQWQATFAASRWFTRGWTLQELLAPRQVEFSSSNWEFIGTRHGESDSIAIITGISKEYLLDSRPFAIGGTHTQSWRSEMLQTANVAQRMGWASSRTTTRLEDIAYCLLGLFGIEMPLIYGEGANAFIRLQEEIARTSPDFTLLAWNLKSMGRADQADFLSPEGRYETQPTALSTALHMLLQGDRHPWCASPGQPPNTSVYPGGCLAPHPSYFRGCESLRTLRNPVEGSADWLLGSNSLTIQGPLSENTRPYLVLPCYPKNDPSKFLSIPLSTAPGGFLVRSWLPTKYVSSQTWHQWPRKRLVFRTRGNHVEESVSEDESTYTLLWLRSVPRCLRLEGTYLLDGDCTTDHQLLQFARPVTRNPAAPLVAFKFRTTGSDEHSAESFGLVIRAPAVSKSLSAQAWKTRSESLGSWPWNIDVLDAQFPAHVFIPEFGQFSDWSELPGQGQLDKMPRDVCLNQHHLSATVSLDNLGGRHVFAIDLHSRHPQVGYYRWQIVHSWIPTAFHIFLDALVALANASGVSVSKGTLEAALLPYLRILGHYRWEILCLMLASHLLGRFTGFLVRSYIHDRKLIIAAWTFLNNGSRLDLQIPQWLSIPVFFWHSLPLISSFLPLSSGYIRQNRWLMAALLGLLSLRIPLRIPLPRTASTLIYTALWGLTETWQMEWWQILGYQGRFLGYTALQLSYTFLVMLTRVCLGEARNVIDPGCDIVPLDLCKGPSSEAETTAVVATWWAVEIIWLWLRLACGVIVVDWWRTAATRNSLG
jgi:hypothetical protein